jgi:hypothetical protein
MFGIVMSVHKRTVELNANPKLRSVPRIMQITQAHFEGKSMTRIMAKNNMNDIKRPLKKPVKYTKETVATDSLTEQNALNVKCCILHNVDSAQEWRKLENVYQTTHSMIS